MEARFQPAETAIRAGNIELLKSLIREDPTLATTHSNKSHPTLLQCLVLDAKDLPNQLDMAKVLLDAGSEIDAPLIAAASVGNSDAAKFLLDAGAAIDGDGMWSPIEEALYWNQKGTVELLVSRGAAVSNLRIAAGLGRTDVINTFFDADGELKPEGGKMAWPFGKLLGEPGSWREQDLINNALIYASTNDQSEAVELLLKKGADVNSIPPGFDYNGTALHNAALQGHRSMVDLLLKHGADPTIKDGKVQGTAAGWAEHAGHHDLASYLHSLTR